MDINSGISWLEKTILHAQGHPVPILANLASFISTELVRLNIPCNWCGFYVLTKNEKDLLLGPFSTGKPACVRLKVKNSVNPVGVCAFGLMNNKTTVVSNVHDFPGHIACDEESKSELVVPVRDADGKAVAVLDIDSPVLAGFSEEIVESIQVLMDYLEENGNDIKWTPFRNTVQ